MSLQICIRECEDGRDFGFEIMRGEEHGNVLLIGSNSHIPSRELAVIELRNILNEIRDKGENSWRSPNLRTLIGNPRVKRSDKFTPLTTPLIGWIYEELSEADTVVTWKYGVTLRKVA